MLALSLSGPVRVAPAPSLEPPVVAHGVRGGFTENRGQWDAKAKFMAHTATVDVWVTQTGLVYNWHGPSESKGVHTAFHREPSKPNDDAVSVDFVGATGAGKPLGLQPMPGHTNFYKGNLKAANIRQFGEATIQDLYPGIDLVAYIDKQEQRPRYDLVVHPGADPNQIKMRFGHAKNLKTDKDGQLSYETRFGKVQETRQMAYQKSDHGPDFQFLPAQVLNPDGTVSFDTTGYRKDRTLVIDPLVWATYIGGTDGDTEVTNFKVDAAHNVYTCGTTTATDLPVVGATNPLTGAQDVFLAKFDSAGNCLFTTYYGGSADDTPAAIGLDTSGNLYIAGSTASTNLPVVLAPSGSLAAVNGFWAEFNASTGAIESARYLQDLNGLTFTLKAGAFGSDGKAYLAGLCDQGGGANLETFTLSSFNITHNTTFTNFSGQIQNLALDSANNVFVAGSTNRNTTLDGYQSNLGDPSNPGIDSNAIVLQLDPTMSAVQHGTYLGGLGEIFCAGLAIDPSDSVFVTAATNDAGLGVSYPLTAGALNVGNLSHGGVVSKLSNDLSTLQASCLFSGPSVGTIGPIAVDSAGNPVFFTATETVAAMPLTWDYFSGHFSPIVIAKLNPTLDTELYGTYYGTTATLTVPQIAVDDQNFIYFAGQAEGDIIETTPGAFQTALPSNDSGYMVVIDPHVTPGLQRIASDRGATPALAGGVGKQVNVSVYFAEPDGTHVTLTSPDPNVYVNGGTTGTYVVTGSVHVASFAVTADDVATAKTVTLTASDGTNTLTIPVTIQPFVRLIVLRPTSAQAGTALTAYVYPYEVPQTDQSISIVSDPLGDIFDGGTTIKGISSGASISGPTTASLSTAYYDATVVGTITASLDGGASSASTSFTFIGPQVTSLAFSPTIVGAGKSSTLTMHTSSLAPDDVVYHFASSNPALAPDIDLTVPQNAANGSANVTVGQTFGTANIQVNYTGILDGVKKVIPLTINPNTLGSILISSGKAASVEGETLGLIASLRYKSATDLAFQVTSNYPSTAANFQFTVPAGTTFVGVPFPTISTGLTASRTLTLSVQWLGADGATPTGPIMKASTLVVPLLSSITLSGTTVKGGTDITGTITFAIPYDRSQSITVMSGNPVAYFNSGDPTLTLSSTTMANSTTVPFTIHTQAVTKNKAVVITIPTPVGYRTKTFNLTITP